MAFNNSITLIGNLGSVPRIGQTAKGHKWANVNLAVSEQKGETYTTHWFRVSAWNKTAERLSVLDKGSRIILSGRLRTSTYEKNGEKRVSTEIVAEDFGVITERAHEPEDQEVPQAPEEPFNF